MNTKDTRRIMNSIKIAVAQSIERNNDLLTSQQAVALVLAMKDHIDALEKEITYKRLTERKVS